MYIPRFRVRPLLEQLEDRTVPTSVRLVSGELIISNPLVVDGKAALTVTATANNTFQVVNDGASLGTYNVAGNIYIFGSTGMDSITFDLAGNNYTGNLLISPGNGSDSVNLLSTGGAGDIAGNVTLIHGSGNESVSLNAAPNATTGLTIGGSVVASNSTSGYNTFALGNASASTTIGGGVTLSNFSDSGTTPAVQIGQGQFDTIGGALNVLGPTDNNNVTVNLGMILNANLAQGVSVGSLTVNEGNGNDTVSFFGASVNDFNSGILTPGVGTVVNGNTLVQFGGGNDYFNVDGDRMENIGGQETQFNGNVTYQAGNGNDSINLAGGPILSGIFVTIAGNLNIQLGSGNNDFGDEATAGGSNGGLDFTGTVVQGNLNLASGNGNNTMDYFGLQVNGNENFTFGNGNNGTANSPILIRNSGNQLNFSAGNGNNYLQLATPFPGQPPLTSLPVFNVNIQFGNGNDTLLLGYPSSGPPFPIQPGFPGETGLDDQGGILTGRVSAGNGLNNVFMQSPLWMISSPFLLTGFP